MVSTWLTIITLLVVSVLHDLEARYIYFTLAFSRADLDVDVYIDLLPGFDMGGNTSSRIIKLNKSLYGAYQSRHNWWNLLKSILETRCYENQSATDPCLLIGKESIVLIYVGDCIIFSRK